MSGLTRVVVATEVPHEVVIGPGALSALPVLFDPAPRRVAVIHPPGLPAAAAARAAVASSGAEVVDVEVPAGEAAKTAEVAARCWALLGQAGLTRSDAVVGVGGGATTDLAGFVAATFLRGVRLAQVPTTLLGMVDAAVGGKTGINTAEGKNLVGAFHQPVGVVCDLDTLRTLDPRETTSGLAEVVKCGFIADPEILSLVEADPERAAAPDAPALRELVERSVRVKAAVVARDFREATSSGAAVGREALNYGHTLGHAIERAEGYTMRHGEAVAIGMVWVAEVAHAVGRITDSLVARHRRVLSAVGLPVAYAGRAGWDDLLATMRVDKKARGDRIRLVVLDALARPAILDGPDASVLRDAFDRVTGRAAPAAG